MSNILFRGDENPHNSVQISTSELLEISLNQISSAANTIQNATQTSEVLDGLGDIMEIIQIVLEAKNISPESFFEHCTETIESKGRFNKKLAVPKE